MKKQKGGYGFGRQTRESSQRPFDFEQLSPGARHPFEQLRKIYPDVRFTLRADGRIVIESEAIQAKRAELVALHGSATNEQLFPGVSFVGGLM